MPLVQLSDTNVKSGGGSSLVIAQQGRTAAYAKPTDADSALASAVATTLGTNRSPIVMLDRYIPRIYRVSQMNYRYQAPGLENPTIGESVDRSKSQPGALNAAGSINMLNIQNGLEPWLQALTGDKTPTVALVPSSTTALRYTFTPDNNPLPGLTAELLRSDIPDRSFGVQVNQLSFNLSRNQLTEFVLDLIGLDYQINTAGTTAVAGSPTPEADGTTKIRPIPVVAGLDRTGFTENPAAGFAGWSARLLNAAGQLLGGSSASFTYNNNFEIPDDLIGTQGASRVTRGANFRELSAQFTLPYSRENLTAAYDFIENADNGQLTIELRFPRAGADDSRLAFVMANSVFEEIPIPAVDSPGEIANPINMRLLPTTGMNNIVSIEYDVPIANAIQLQQYAA